MKNDTYKNWSVVGTFNALIVLFLRFFFGKERIDDYTSPLTLLKLTFNGFVAIILVVMIRNLYPLFLKASRVLNLGWEIDSIQAQLVAHSFAIVLLGLMLVSLVLSDKLIFANIQGENAKPSKYVVWITALTFSLVFMCANMYQFAQKDVSKNVDTTKYAKIDTYQDNSTKSIDKQIDFLKIAYQNELATQKENLDKAALLQKRSNINVIGNKAVKENRIEIQRYEASANVHFIESQNILEKIQRLENKKEENILILKEQNAQIESNYQNEVSFYENIGILKGCLLEILLFLFITGNHFLNGKVAQYNTVKSTISINDTQRNKTIQRTNNSIALPKLPKVKVPKLKKSVKEKLSSKFKNLSIFENQEEAIATPNNLDLDNLIQKDVEITASKQLSTSYSTIWSMFKDLGLKSGLITKYTQLKKQEQQDIFRFIADLDVKNFKGKKMTLESYASMIEGLYNINAKDFVNEVELMKEKFFRKNSATKTKMLKVANLENEIIGGAGYKTLFDN